jgi:peptidoglycan hydrolase-like protein with peptidoglycan-binding domain
MALTSNLFAGDARREACAASDSEAIGPGDTGPHVRKLQGAVTVLDAAVIAKSELDAAHYGPSTAGAVLAYKQKRGLADRSDPPRANDLAGATTIKALDGELRSRQTEMTPRPKARCTCDCETRSQADQTQVTDALWSEAQRTHQLQAVSAIRFEHFKTRQQTQTEAQGSLWLTETREVVHPDAPAGRGGPGDFRSAAVLYADSFNHGLPHPWASATRTLDPLVVQMARSSQNRA